MLFGKRRAYQRKLAVADFEGVCSGDIYVLEPIGGDLLPSFLPFVCQSNAFFKHAIDTSAGSLSPRTTWRALADFELLLPSRERQEFVVRLLQEAFAVRGQLEHLVWSAKRLLDAAIDAVASKASARVALNDLCRSPITYGIVQAGPDTPGGVPYVRVSDMTGRDELDPGTMLRTSSAISSSYRRTVLEEGDIVMALRGVPGLCHGVRENMAGGNLSRGVARIAPKPDVHPRFLLWMLRSGPTQRAVRQYANGWKGEDLRELTIGQLRTLPVPSLPAAGQQAAAEELDALQEAWTLCRSRLQAFDEMIAALRERALEPE